MDHMNLSDELRRQLLESAAWGKVGIDLGDWKNLEEGGARKGDKGKGKRGRRDKDYSDGGERKGDESRTHAGLDAGTEYDGDGEQLDEQEIHICPLCTSQLAEAIDEDALVEHLDVVLGLIERLSQLNEGEEDVESVIDETLLDLLVGDEEESEDREEA